MSPTKPPDWNKIKPIFILGPPGAAKTLQCASIAAKNNNNDWIHLNISSHLKSLCESEDTAGSEFGGLNRQIIREYVASHRSIPDKNLVAIVKSKVLSLWAEHEASGRGEMYILLDSFPQTVEAGRMFEEQCTLPFTVLDFHSKYTSAKQTYLSREGASKEGFESWVKVYMQNRKQICERYGLAMIDGMMWARNENRGRA